MYVEKFAYTSSNAEFRQDSESGIINRLYRRTFLRYITYLPLWVCDPAGDSHTEGRLSKAAISQHHHQSLRDHLSSTTPYLYFKGSVAYRHECAMKKIV